ncbi:MAG: excinuclease ABC subunit A [Porphyromonadaceae bacterium]|nr:MAG: excinuclease ABC subunit A [Porphyromonadaceae bacterium]
MPGYSSDAENNILIKGARVHNLKNVDLSIPRDKLIVITGLSGSGKSSLAFDTLYAEGQRRYVESLSSYARQFLGRLDKPDVDLITGIPPAIAIEQRVNTRNPRSTVGTSTEIYDYLKLMFARIGETFSPVSGNRVNKHQVQDVVERIMSLPVSAQILILAPLHKPEDRSLRVHLEILVQQGYTRIEDDGQIRKISEVLDPSYPLCETCPFDILIDRVFIGQEEDLQARVGDSVETAFFEGKGECTLKIFQNGDYLEEQYSNRFEMDGILFEEPSVHLFSFNNPLGACPVCEGFGTTIGIDEDLVVPNTNLSVFEEAIVCWKGEKMSAWKDQLLLTAHNFDFPIHRPFYQLNEQERQLLWTGNEWFQGLHAFFSHLEEKSYKIQYRVMLARYRGKTICPECLGSRLRKEARWVKIGEKSITDLVKLPVSELITFFDSLKLDAHREYIAGRLLTEIRNRLTYLSEVGLGYLTLNRTSNTLSGGESQRINLAGSLGSSLVGSLYILDEPSIGLHPRDTRRLIKVLKRLRDLGNTVLVVEHDEEIIRSADYIIDIGPGAGRFGGEVIFQGTHDQLSLQSKGLTARYLSGLEKIAVPEIRRKWNSFIELKGAGENNLKAINVLFPLEIMTVVTGVSGSGKSTLVNKTLFPALNKRINGAGERTGRYGTLTGDLHRISQVELIDQNPIGKSSRSNPVTYIKAWDEVRKLMAELHLSEMNGYKASHFSFNVDGGRCEECQGEGVIKVEMQFMADVYLTCEHCHGTRFRDEILEVRYAGKNVHDMLEMSVSESLEFFSSQKDHSAKKIAQKLQPLSDVGLGYVKLGQSSSTLSGGESQRIKLASFLTRGHDAGHTLFIFDEPTTGLHFDDIKTLLKAFDALLDRGHTLIIIEHNPEIIKNADWVIDLGPEGGSEGGNLIFAGTPEDLAQCKESYTAQYIIAKLKNR